MHQQVTRRQHTKSRTGCANCKRRKVKCDEVHPICFNCQRHGIECSLSVSSAQPSHRTKIHHRTIPSATQPRLFPPSPLAQDGDVNSSSPLPVAESPFSSAEQMAPFPPSELWIRSCELMHHWCTMTADTLSIRQDMVHVWKVVVPREGYRHPFVMHCILAVAAAHKAYLLPDNRELYITLCDYYQTVGSEGFRSALNDISLSTWMPCFGFASMILIYIFSLPSRSRNEMETDSISSFLELIQMVKGIRTTLLPIVPKITMTEFAPLVYSVYPLDQDDTPDQRPDLSNSFLPNDTWEAIDKLHEFLESRTPSGGFEPYRLAIENLQRCTRLMAIVGTHCEPGPLVTWIYPLDDSVLLDIRERRPQGLLLLGQFCVMFITLEKNFWFLRGWARPVFADVERNLKRHPEFLTMLECQKRRMEEFCL